jgi:nicotinamide-nucleotide amidase
VLQRRAVYYDMLAEIITIGDEILIGQIVDTNSAWMASELNAIGIKIRQITSVSDDRDHIKEAVRVALEVNDIVLLTGGLGPTRDDITKYTLAEFFDSKLVFDQKAYDNVSAIFEKRGLKLIESNEGQAMLPEKCTPIYNSCGTAPGMWFEESGKILVSMPGVPYEMKEMMRSDIIPRFKEKLKLPVIIHHTIQTAGLGESFIAKKIEEVENALPSHIKLAYLPSLGAVRLRLTAYGEDKAILSGEVSHYASLIINLLADTVFGEGDLSLPEKIYQLLKEKEMTLSIAESCSGGYISSLITKVPGCSAVYEGSFVTYSYNAKKNELGVKAETLETSGAVSEACVSEMLDGCMEHFKTSCAIAVSGIAGPDGGTPDKPVGTIVIGVKVKEKKFIKRFVFENDRSRNIERTAMAALNMLRLQLLRY